MYIVCLGEGEGGGGGLLLFLCSKKYGNMKVAILVRATLNIFFTSSLIGVHLAPLSSLVVSANEMKLMELITSGQLRLVSLALSHGKPSVNLA